MAQVITESVTRVGNPIGFDLGQGFSKISYNGIDVEVEPSVVALQDDKPVMNRDIDKINVLNRDVFIGHDADISGKPALPVLGVGRYTDAKFAEIYFGCLGKKYRKDVIIPLVVMGLPVNRFMKKREELVKICKDKKVVTLNDNQKITISVENVDVVLEPVGTWWYLLQTQKDQLDVKSPNKLNLFIDGGHGSLDITSLQGISFDDWKGSNLGMSVPYGKIHTYLLNTYDELTIGAKDIGFVLRDGFNWNGKTVNIDRDPEVIKILDSHFEQVISDTTEKFQTLTKFANVIWTGGMANAHKERIQSFAKKYGMENFVIVDKAQEANALGFYWYGKSLMGVER